MTITLELDMPDDAPLLTFPHAVSERLQHLLDRQDAGERLTEQERAEASGLVELAELVSWLRLRARRIAR